MAASTRRTFLAHGAALLATSIVAEAQQPAKMHRLGVLALGGQQIPTRYFVVAQASFEGALSPLLLTAVAT